MSAIRILTGDALETLRTLPDASVNCCVTSPPYFGLRDYGVDGQVGLEATPDEYVTKMVGIMRDIRRVLKDDGTLWLNIGDSYAGGGKGGNPDGGKQATNAGSQTVGCLYGTGMTAREAAVTNVTRKTFDGIKAKDLIGIPWMLAFALRADGWYLRKDIIWHKPNPMPESVTDRPTSAHEYVFLLSKSPRYWYDAEAIAEDATGLPAGNKQRAARPDEKVNASFAFSGSETRNKRSVWTIATKPFSEAHFATMAPELAETCIKAGCPLGGTVIDPFGGAGTTALMADRLGRNAILIELNPAYVDIARKRLSDDAGMFAEVAA